MNIALQIAAGLAVVTEPFLPFSSDKLKAMLKLPELGWKDVEASAALIPAGHQIDKATLLFSKIEMDCCEILKTNLDGSPIIE